MTFEQVRALAVKLAAKITYHAPSGTTQIDGHRWDRWYDLRNGKPVPDLVILRNGITQVHRGQMYA